MGIEWENQEKMKTFLGQFENAGLQFCDVSRFVDQYELTTNNPHISNETYYRFLIQELLPYYSKVLYLDSDLIVKGDVSELFSVDLGDKFACCCARCRLLRKPQYERRHSHALHKRSAWHASAV